MAAGERRSQNFHRYISRQARQARGLLGLLVVLLLLPALVVRIYQ